MDISYKFVNYGEDILPERETIVLDVGMRTVPGVIDHHHLQAEPECTASLIVKHPNLVLDHLEVESLREKQAETRKLLVITHRLPDFDSLASIFLTLKLIETGRVDGSMEKIARYTKMVDSASLPKNIDLPATPYSILRALFAGARKEEGVINRERVDEGLRFMRFLYAKCGENFEILENRSLFSGVDRFARAMHKAEEDYFNYLHDLGQSLKIIVNLPAVSGPGRKKVDGLVVRNPRSFLLKEWARRDLNSPSSREGFSLIMTNFGNQRYIIGVDPEQGVNLKGLADILNQRESVKRTDRGRPGGRRWYDGNNAFFNFRITDSPQDGTLLTHQEIVDCLLEFGRE